MTYSYIIVTYFIIEIKIIIIKYYLKYYLIIEIKIIIKFVIFRSIILYLEV